MGLMADLVERIWRSCWRNLSEGGWTDRRLHRVGKRNDNDQEIPFQFREHRKRFFGFP